MGFDRSEREDFRPDESGQKQDSTGVRELRPERIEQLLQGSDAIAQSLSVTATMCSAAGSSLVEQMTELFAAAGHEEGGVDPHLATYDLVLCAVARSLSRAALLRMGRDHARVPAAMAGEGLVQRYFDMWNTGDARRITDARRGPAASPRTPWPAQPRAALLRASARRSSADRSAPRAGSAPTSSAPA